MPAQSTVVVAVSKHTLMVLFLTLGPGLGIQTWAQSPASKAAQEKVYSKKKAGHGIDQITNACPPTSKPSLSGFSPQFGGKADSVVSTQFPNPVGANGVSQWLSSTAAAMKHSVSLHLDAQEQSDYNQIEVNTCGNSVYCRISVAQQAIDYLLKKNSP